MGRLNRTKSSIKSTNYLPPRLKKNFTPPVPEEDGSPVVLSDDEAVEAEPGLPGRPKNDKFKLKFVRYRNNNLEWLAFNRSTQGGSGRHHYAQCRSCMLVVPGRLPLMREHVGVCEIIEEDIKKRILAVREPKPENKAVTRTIPQMFKHNPTLQDESEIFLGLFVIANDLSFR